MEYDFLNSSNLSYAFVDELRSTRELYFSHEREHSVPSSDQESEESNSEDEDSEQIAVQESDTPIEWRVCDERENQKVTTLLQDGCGCSLGPDGENCNSQFTEEQLQRHRESYRELSSSELDIAVLSQLQACTRQDQDASSARQKTTRKRQRTSFSFQGNYMVLHSICRKISEGYWRKD